jgi:hypothetical protein
MPDLAQLLISSRSCNGTQIVKEDAFTMDNICVAHLKEMRNGQKLYSKHFTGKTTLKTLVWTVDIKMDLK